MVKKLLFRLLVLFLLIILTVVPINYFVDPALVLRDGEYERIVADALLKNKYVGVNDNYNERRLQRELIKGLNEKYDTLILGSSRAMLIPTEALGEKNAFSSGVTGAVIEDIVAIVGMYDKKGFIPDKVYICIDPWLFNDSHSDTRYLELLAEYNDFIEELWLHKIPETVDTKNWYLKLEQAVSFTYFQESVKNLNNRPEKPKVREEIVIDMLTRLPDGTIEYPYEFLARTEERVALEVNAVISSEYIYHSTNYLNISPSAMSKLMGLVNYYERNETEVFFILSPLHPILYEYISESPDFDIILQVEDLVKNFADERKIPVIGSYNPKNVGALAIDFYDAYHPKREFMFLLMEEFCAN